jgi:hypothetical protein
MGFVFFERKIKIDHVIRKNKNENDNSSLIKLNSRFEFTSMQWIPKIVEYSKVD